MPHRTARTAGLTTAALTLAACGALSTPKTSPPAVLERARTVPTIAAEALSLQAELEHGLTFTTAERLHFTTLDVQDPLGYPFTTIVFTSTHPLPRPIAGTANELAPTPAGSTYAVGASTARARSSASTPNLDLLDHLHRTAAALGGPDRVRRVLSFTGALDVYLEDDAGTLWPAAANPAPLDPARAAELRAGYDRVAARNDANHAYFDALERDWAPILDGDSNAFTTAAGHLDTRRAVAVTRRRGFRTAARDDTARPAFDGESSSPRCWPFLWWQVCDASYAYEAPAYSMQRRISGGAWQDHDLYAHAPTEWTQPLGCGPASFVSLASWYWKHPDPNVRVNWYGNAYSLAAYGTDLPYFSEAGRSLVYSQWYAPGSVAWAMTNPINGQPDIAARMGAFGFISGTAVFPGGWVQGANAWLEDQAARGVPKYNAYGSWYITNWLGTEPPKMAYALRERMAGWKRPVIALHYAGGGQWHYSPVLRYRVVYGATVEIHVLALDNVDDMFRQGEVNIAAPWNLMGGVFWLDH